MIRKSMPSDLIRGWAPVFPRDKREAFARRSCSNKKIERDDDSKKSHPALGPFAARCGWPCTLPVHHGLKLLSDLEVQLCDTLVELALAAILGMCCTNNTQP